MHRLYRVSVFRDEFIGFFPSVASAQATAENLSLGTDDEYYVTPSFEYEDDET